MPRSGSTTASSKSTSREFVAVVAVVAVVVVVVFDAVAFAHRFRRFLRLSVSSFSTDISRCFATTFVSIPKFS